MAYMDIKSEKERLEADRLRAEIAATKSRTFDYLRLLARMTPTELLQSGYRNGAANAVLEKLRKTEVEIEQMIRKHEKSYPS